MLINYLSQKIVGKNNNSSELKLEVNYFYYGIIYKLKIYLFKCKVLYQIIN